jgi:antitoxin CptB
MDAKSADEPFAIDAHDAHRRRLRYRAWHRGTKEMDLMLGPYADAHVVALDATALDRLEAFMEAADTDLLKWVMGQEVPPTGTDRELLAAVVAFRQDSLARK